MTQVSAPGVYVTEVPSGPRPIQGVGTSTAAFIGFTARAAPQPGPFLVNGWTEFIKTFGDPPAEGTYLHDALYGWFANGGGPCYVVRIGDAADDGDADTGPRIEIPSPSGDQVLRLNAKDPAATGIEAVIRPATDGNAANFNLQIRGAGQEKSYENLTFSKRGVKPINDDASSPVQAEVVSRTVTGTALLPEGNRYSLTPGAVGTAVPANLSVDMVKGSTDERSGVDGLDAIDDVTIVCLPDLMWALEAGKLQERDVLAIQNAALDHCERMKDRFAILDCPPGKTPQEAVAWRSELTSSRYGALYYPWIQVPVSGAANGRNSSRILPPSGHVAGIYARVDQERGVFKAPANEVVRGASGLERQVTQGEQAALNPRGVNCIRAFPNRGIRVWGARTLQADGIEYVNVRRLMNYLSESIEEGTQWVVFEPNDRDLWERVRRDISAFLTSEWRRGALFGSTPEEAFYVKCDDELNPHEERVQGRLHIEIGVAPVMPAEFVLIQITQTAGEQSG